MKIYALLIWKEDDSFKWRIEEREYKVEDLAETDVYKQPEQVHEYREPNGEDGRARLVVLACNIHILKTFFNGVRWGWKVHTSWNTWFEEQQEQSDNPLDDFLTNL